MDIASKLGIYKKKSQPITENATKKSIIFPDESIADKLSINGGTVWRFENRLSLFDVYSPVNISPIRELDAFLEINGFSNDFSLSDLLFFDLETTSLSIASGNYPFVCGIGYTDGDDFVTEQLFMESYSDEKAILTYLLDFFNRSKAVVTFNGNSFDLPLIKNRYMLNRIYGFPVNIPSIDLIVSSRRIFKSLYESCSLQTLEKNILGFERIDDIPGWMIPEIYYTYQKDGDSSRLPGVIEHNMYDIFSMYILLQILSSIFSDIKKGNFRNFATSSLFTIARCLFVNNTELFLQLAEYLGTDLFGDDTVFEKFSIVLKRNKEWYKAVDYWNKSGSFFSLIELAKYYEHKEKKYIQALNVSNKANEILSKKETNKDENPDKVKKRRDLLQVRINRLKKKISASNNGTNPSL
ncbi:MAG TPA: ribonuclease H-like domain-containing protein [Spirochaetota bacterium]|nr:ribonuclease H-like domain-containing protein [Spirochaetota bacterium]